MTNALFTEGKVIPGKIASSFLALAGLVARIPGSHPGFPGSVVGKGVKISLHVIAPSLRSRTAVSKKSPTNKSYSGERGTFPHCC